MKINDIQENMTLGQERKRKRDQIGMKLKADKLRGKSREPRPFPFLGKPDDKEQTNEARGTQYYRDLDQGQLNHTKSMLMKSRDQLKVAIAQREKFGKQLMGNGDRAGTGDLYSMLNQIDDLIDNWDDQTKLYGT